MMFAKYLDVRQYVGVTTRRERLRAATVAEIKQAALEQIAAEGATALSIRGIARSIGMSPAGLYRYYDSLDALLTELIADAYNDLADAVVTATTSPGSVRQRLLAGMLAYREWCLEHPNRFLLVFGTPIPGYAAPEEGPTVEANRRIGTAFFAVVAEGWSAGALALPVPARPPTPEERTFLASVAQGGAQASASSQTRFRRVCCAFPDPVARYPRRRLILGSASMAGGGGISCRPEALDKQPLFRAPLARLAHSSGPGRQRRGSATGALPL